MPQDTGECLTSYSITFTFRYSLGPEGFTNHGELSPSATALLTFVSKLRCVQPRHLSMDVGGSIETTPAMRYMFVTALVGPTSLQSPTYTVMECKGAYSKLTSHRS